MKTRLLKTVFASDLKSRAVLVMNYLIFRSNSAGTCFPAIKTIARECHISVNTVKRALDDLVAAGYVKKDARFIEAKNGAQTSNLYTLCEGVFMSNEIEVKPKLAPPAPPPESNLDDIERETFEKRVFSDSMGKLLLDYLEQNNKAGHIILYASTSCYFKTSGHERYPFAKILWAGGRPIVRPP